MSLDNKIRYARKPVIISCLLVLKGESMVMDVKNISASGIMLEFEEQTEIALKLQDYCVLEIIINDEFNLNVEAEVTRISQEGVGLKFIQIPEDKQIPLWELLGDHVDKVEK